MAIIGICGISATIDSNADFNVLKSSVFNWNSLRIGDFTFIANEDHETGVITNGSKTISVDAYSLLQCINGISGLEFSNESMQYVQIEKNDEFDMVSITDGYNTAIKFVWVADDDLRILWAVKILPKCEEAKIYDDSLYTKDAMYSGKDGDYNIYKICICEDSFTLMYNPESPLDTIFTKDNS